MSQQFWVIGGEFRDAEFHEIEPASSRVLGPFHSYDEANTVWRQRAEESRSQAYIRYSIVASAPNPARRLEAVPA